MCAALHFHACPVEYGTRGARRHRPDPASGAFEALFLHFKYRAEGGDFAPDKHGRTHVVTGPAPAESRKNTCAIISMGRWPSSLLSRSVEVKGASRGMKLLS
jgi:hypothetical protein